MLVDVRVYLPNGGGKIAQQIFHGQSFAAGEARDYRWDFGVPASFADGLYVVKVGVFSAGWSALHAWDDQAATFQVSGGGGLPPAGDYLSRCLPAGPTP